MWSLLISCALLLISQNNFIDADYAEEKSDISERIYGGQLGNAAMFPWHVIVAVQPSIFPQICGGALISPKFVLTTAECCLRNKTSQLIAVGQDKLEYVPLFIRATKITPHPKYDAKTRQYDICIIELPKKLDITDKVKPIALPKERFEPKVYDNKNVTYAGFGQSEDPNPIIRTISKTMRYGQQIIIPSQECYDKFHANSSYPQIVKRDTLCMTLDPTYAWNGDKGDAMFVTGESPPVLMGLISWYDYDSELPTLATNVPSFLPFIGKYFKG